MRGIFHLYNHLVSRALFLAPRGRTPGARVYPRTGLALASGWGVGVGTSRHATARWSSHSHVSAHPDTAQSHARRPGGRARHGRWAVCSSTFFYKKKLITRPHPTTHENDGPMRMRTVGSRVWMRHLCMHLFYTYIYSYTKRDERQHRWRARSVRSTQIGRALRARRSVTPRGCCTAGAGA